MCIKDLLCGKEGCSSGLLVVWTRYYLWHFCIWAVEEMQSINILVSVHMFTNICLFVLLSKKDMSAADLTWLWMKDGIVVCEGDYERKQLCCALRCYTSIYLKGLRKTMETSFRITYCLGPSSLSPEGMRKLWCGQWQREGNISTLQNESIDWVCLCFATCLFPLVFVGITKRGYNSPRADPVHAIEHRLFVASFSPWRHIFRRDVRCVHQLSSGLLIGSVALLIPSPLPIPHPTGLKSTDPNSNAIPDILRTDSCVLIKI
jgi:hypothetical protein